jgi:subtilisin family serine protease
LVDDGVDIFHEDLIANFGDDNFSYTPETLPYPGQHGTACAGIIAAEEGNGIGGRGVAPQAHLVSFNAVKAPAIANLADALQRDAPNVWVSNNSWGDFNAWGDPFKLRSAIEASLEIGIAKGRHGLGTVYVFSAGNGAILDGSKAPADNVNLSGYVNNRFTIPVCAVGADGKRSYYSEPGATLIVCGPSNSTTSLPGIVTSDETGDDGYNPKVFKDDYEDHNYTKFFGGTSASAPIVSGVVALMLEANPRLGWRDVKAILSHSAAMVDASDPEWITNAAGLHVNHQYGFGLIDADAAIAMAQIWKNLGPLKTTELGITPNIAIPDDTGAAESTLDITDNLNIEFVDITVDIPDHQDIGQLEIRIESPAGTESILAEQHRDVFPDFRYHNWRFGSARYLGESSKGTWKVTVADKQNGFLGTLVSWSLKIYGT